MLRAPEKSKTWKGEKKRVNTEVEEMQYLKKEVTNADLSENMVAPWLIVWLYPDNSIPNWKNAKYKMHLIYTTY